MYTSAELNELNCVGGNTQTHTGLKKLTSSFATSAWDYGEATVLLMPEFSIPLCSGAKHESREVRLGGWSGGREKINLVFFFSAYSGCSAHTNIRKTAETGTRTTQQKVGEKKNH